jgi:hypothetical protein
MTPMTDLAPVVARLEQENRNLIARLERLEKRRGSAFAALMANVLLLLCAALLVGYLGFFPPGVERLPLMAQTVETDELILRGQGATGRAFLLLDSKGFHVLDGAGHSLIVRPEKGLDRTSEKSAPASEPSRP